MCVCVCVCVSENGCVWSHLNAVLHVLVLELDQTPPQLHSLLEIGDFKVEGRKEGGREERMEVGRVGGREGSEEVSKRVRK